MEGITRGDTSSNDAADGVVAADRVIRVALAVLLALLSGLKAHVRPGFFETGRGTKRSWPCPWIGARQNTGTGRQASRAAEVLHPR